MLPLRGLAGSCALALLVSGASLSAQSGKGGGSPLPPALGEAGTEALCGRFSDADHWVQKAVILLSLNRWWHPVGSSMILEALRGKDRRLRAFAVEALLRSDESLLPMVATPELLEELIMRQLGNKNDLFAERVGKALRLLAPDAGVESRTEWARWWRQTKDAYAPAAWKAGEKPASGGGTVAAAERAFDLYQNGLEIMICIDSTGSMQPTIDALGQALGGMVDILDGISPKLRLGIVQYKDYGELGKTGAKVVQPFSKNIKAARKNLEKLRAYGGGDLPEAVLGGLEQCFDKRMKWKKGANKLVILIGDAPPHADEAGRCVELARRMHDDPGAEPGKPLTGPKGDRKPFLTSCIGVFLEIEGDQKPPRWGEFEASQEQMREDFTAIAEAGGGIFVDVAFKLRMGPPPTSKEKKKNRERGDTTADRATKRIVEHIMVLSFGKRFAREMRDFVRIFYEYGDAGMFK